MRLELANFPVKDVRFTGHTSYSNGVLEADKEELLKLILEDKRVESADVDVAFPDEQTRIVLVREVVEPRVKISGKGCVFPGIMGAPETVGDGRTHRLSGVTVMTSVKYRPTITSGTAMSFSGTVDMWGPGSQVTPFGSLINIVLVLKLIDEVTEVEAHSAIQLAAFKVAHRLAETTRNKTPENVEVFELAKTDPSLPRVVYNLCAYTEWHIFHSGVALYGYSVRESLPTFIHPNEFFDGVLTPDARRTAGVWTTSWGWMNHPVVVQLLKEHGKRLNFLGVVLQRTRFEAQSGKQMTAAITSQMARLLEADGAIFTRLVPSGNNFMDVMLTLQAYEEKGIKTVLLTPEWGGSEGNEIPLMFYVPGATAMVTTGSSQRTIKLPAPTKVIGGEDSQPVDLCPGDTFAPWGEATVWRGFINGGVDWWGGGYGTCEQY